MTAKEMFEKLGYELVEDNRMFLTYRYTGETPYVIRFDRTSHCYRIKNLIHEQFVVKYELYEAITKQLKELWWLR